jgi:hypothetical protein
MDESRKQKPLLLINVSTLQGLELQQNVPRRQKPLLLLDTVLYIYMPIVRA